MSKVFVFTICLGALLLGSLACAGSVRSSQAEEGGIEETQPQSAPQPTVTAFPTPPPLKFMPQAPPKDGDLAAIVHYANSMQPLFVDAGAILERDGEILKASEDGNDAVLCDGRLAADNVSMQEIINEVRAIQPPQDRQAVVQDTRSAEVLGGWRNPPGRGKSFLDINSRNRSGRLGPALKVGISSCWRMS